MGVVSIFVMGNYSHQPFGVSSVKISLIENELILETEILHHADDNTIYGVLVKLFSSVQKLIFLAYTVFHPLLYAL